MDTFLIPTEFSTRNKEHICLLQQALAALKFHVDQDEIEEREYGQSTMDAVKDFQAMHCLPLNSNVPLETVNTLNQQLGRLHRVCGYVTDTYGMPIEGVSISVTLMAYNEEVLDIGTGITLSDASYRIYLFIPGDYFDKTGSLITKICVKMDFSQNGDFLFTEEHLIIHDTESLFNFSSDKFSYSGKSVYSSLENILSLNRVDASELASISPKELIKISSITAIDIEVLMKIIFSNMLSSDIILDPTNSDLEIMIGSDIYFGLLYQNFPSNMPLQLFNGSMSEMEEGSEEYEEWVQYKGKTKTQISIGLTLMTEDELYNSLLIACKRYFINSYSEAQIKGFAQSILISKIENVYEKPILEGDVSLSDVLESVGVDLNEEQEKEIGNMFIANINNFNSFIESLDTPDIKGKYGEEMIDNLQHGLQVSRLTRNCASLNVAIQETYHDVFNISGTRSIAAVPYDELEVLINNGGHYPVDFEPEAYAKFVYNNIQELYPDISAISRIKELGKFEQATEIRNVLLRNPQFDILVDRIEDCEEYDSIKANANLLSEFKTIQQVYRISPSPAVTAVMLDNGITNAGQVYFIGKRQLQETFKNTLTQAEIDSVFNMATARFTCALTAFVNINSIFRAVTPALVASYDIEWLITQLKPEFPDIEILLGDMDYCECKHDSSVYSSAAYLADLLTFLDDRKSNTSSKTVRDCLNDRRPDISNIYLSEKNTNTTLPYIDLVCEVLEETAIKIADTAFVRNVTSCQSTLSTKELCAAPEHLLKSSIKGTAYDILKNSIFPMYAPLNLYLAENRAYLKKMGITRHHLMNLFQKNGDTSENINIAAEYFGLTNFETDIVTATSPALITRNETWIENPGSGIDAITMSVSSFVESSGLSVHEVLDLVKIYPDKTNWVKISCDNFTTDCSHKDKDITGTPLAFDRTHRFIRLWRNSEWKIWELDLLLRSEKVGNYVDVNTDNLTDSTLHNLKLFSQQQKILNLSCDKLLSFYEDINILNTYENGKIKPSLYDAIFLSTTLSNPLNARLLNIKDSNTAEIASDGEDDALIAACLSITKKDYYFLKSKFTGDKNRAYLSYLYRHVTLSQKLKTSVKDLILFLELFGIDIKNPYTIDVLNEIISQFTNLSNLPLSLKEYEYLLDYEYGVTLSDAAQKLVLSDELLEKHTSELYNIITDELLPTDTEEKNAMIDAGIKNYIAEAFDLSSVITELYLDFAYEGENSLLKQFKEENNYETGNNLAIYKILILIHKAVLFIKANDINANRFELLLNIQNQLDFNWFEFKTGPAVSGITFVKLLNLQGMELLQKSYGLVDDKTLYGIIDDYKESTASNIPADDFCADLCNLTKWDLKTLNYLKGTAILDLALGDFYSPAIYSRLANCLEMISISGVSVETFIGWRTREKLDNDEIKQNTEIKNAAKALYDVDTWLNELPELQKPIREAKSNALASYLISYSLRTIDKLWKDKIDLYNHFLLDTEMSACMKTSRIVQATLSVQLFVQRCFLNLEKDVTVNEDEWKQWEWMKKYRLWEANRKVFLYPENWIEPELRDDKTPFFKALEDELSQSDVTKEQAETVFENYLQKLHTVSNLMVCGIFREVVDSNDGIDKGGMETYTSKVDTLHVIARTKSSPFEYYYRNYNALDAIWSHWEKVEVDIKGDVVIPMVYNRKLHLFWLSIVEKIENKNNGTTDAQTPDEYTEIQLGWSVFKNKKWTAAQYSHKKFIQLKHYPTVEYSLVATYLEDTNEVRLDVYHLYDVTPNYCTVLSGSFYFDGDVSKSISDHSDISEKMVKKMNYDTRPELNYFDSRMIEELGNNTVLYASRLYPVRKLGKSDVCLYSSKAKNSDGLTSKFMSTTNQNPNIIQMLHHHEQTLLAVYSAKLAQNVTSVWSPVLSGMFTIFNNTPTDTITVLDNSVAAVTKSHSNLWYGLYESHLYNPFFYQDSKRSFFVKPFDVSGSDAKYKLSPFYHAYTNLFIKELNRCGIDGLMNRNIQVNPHLYKPYNSFDFKTEYSPAANVVLAEDYQTAKNDILDFSLSGAYSAYNWELFFHTPLYIACKLSQNQKYEDAMHWFHYIFNPMDKSDETSPQKFWITKPFFSLSTSENRVQDIRNILKNIQTHAAEVNAWLNNPFKPHLVARTRLVAYQKTVVMKYIDNLINWADQLFRQDTMESNNEATLLYMLAYEILGKRPVTLPENNLDVLSQKNYNGIKGSINRYSFLDYYDNAIQYAFEANQNINSVAKAEIASPAFYLQESSYDNASKIGLDSLQGVTGLTISELDLVKVTLPAVRAEYESSAKVDAQSRYTTAPFVTNADTPPLPRIDAANFCIPFNDNLLGYWDRVEDRLFKLRHCMNIDGIVRELPLFEPPIDPAVLVKAAATGLSIADALNTLYAPQPYYRFRVILQKAIEFANEVKQLGDKLLSALEKKDAETLTLLRSSQEIAMQQAMKQIRTLQIEEAKQNMEAVIENIKNAERRKEYYASKEFMNDKEIDSYEKSADAAILAENAGTMRKIAGSLVAIPEFSTGGAGVGGSPLVNVLITGGHKIAGAMNFVAEWMSINAQVLEKSSSLLSIQAGYQRRKEDWDFQAEMAEMEIQQLNKQLTASEIRLMMAEKELENLDLQIEQSQSVKEYYQNKYTNEALYNWMITQTSSVYFQSYKLAYEMAKTAETCYANELGIYDTTNFIQFDNWDSLKRGLLSGEKLIYDLHKLDAAYINGNKRTLELTKHISMAQMFPNELLTLIADKETTLNLPEWIFDMDYPGHYMRRIKSVSVTIPNVAGPNTTVSFMLTLKQAVVRKVAAGDYDEPSMDDINRFYYQTGGLQSICTSSAQNDSGMFELNFNDERYLPFENAGVISTWIMKFPGINQFDLSSISDVILHINYTALSGGDDLATKAKNALNEKLPDAGALFFSPKQDFPDQWNKMDENNFEMNFEIKTEHLPFFLRGRNDIITKDISVVLITKEDKNGVSIAIGKENSPISLSLLKSEQENGDVFIYQGSIKGQNIDSIGQWSIETQDFQPDEIEDIVIGFSLQGGNN